MKTLLVFALLTATAQATIYHVSTSGDSGNDGLSEGNAWDLYTSCTDLSASDTVYIHPGDYQLAASSGHDWFHWSAGFQPQVSGTASGHTTYRNAPGEAKPVIRGNQSTDIPAAWLYNVSYIRFDSLIFKKGDHGVFLQNADNIQMYDCVVDSTEISQTSDNTGAVVAPDNTINASVDVEVKRCSLMNVNAPNDNGLNTCAVMSYLIDGLTVESCYTENIRGIVFFAKEGSPNWTIAYNYCDQSSGGYISGSSAWLAGDVIDASIHHNIAIGGGDTESWAVPGDFGNGNSWSGSEIYNNTIYDWGRAFEATNTDGGGTEIFNNIFWWSTNESGFEGPIQSYVGYDPGDIGDWSYNIIYNETASNVTQSGLTYAQFVALGHTGSGPGDVDPELTDPGNGDFTLQEGSPAEDGGRGGAYDTYIGAVDPETEVSNTCPTITLNTPSDGDTIAATTFELDADFADTDGDTLTVVFILGYDDPPEDTLVDTTLIADDDLVYSPTSLTEDSTYYGMIIACDTGGCCDTLEFSVLIDSVEAVEAGPANIYDGTTLDGVTIGRHDGYEESTAIHRREPRYIDRGVDLSRRLSARYW